MKKTPLIRFKTFSSNWESHKLSQMCSVFTDGDWIESKDQHSSGIRLIQTGNVGTTVYNDKPQNKKWVSYQTFERLNCTEIFPGDILISRLPDPAGRACIIPDIGEKMITAVDCTIARCKEEYSSEFLVQYLSTSNYFKEVNTCLAGGTRQRISRGNLSQFEILVPNEFEEQLKIGKLFKLLDDTIMLHENKLDKLNLTKKSMLFKMFPRNGATKPEIRFGDFSNDWVCLQMKEIVSKYDAPVPTPSEGYYRLGIRSHAKGTFHSFVETGMQLETAQMHKVASDKFIVNITFGWEHAVAITNKDDEGKLVSHRFPQFSFNKGMVPQYFKYLIIDEKFKHHLDLSSPGGAGRNRVLKIDEMLEYKFWTTSEPEQQKIAEFFNNLDNLIKLQEKKIEKLKNTKKALLRKMFV